MRFHRAAIVVLAMVAASALGAAPGESPIRLPSRPVVPQPMPGPMGPLHLGDDRLFVIDCKVECVVRCHPAGLVKVTKKKGPRDISAKFVDGTGFTEDRTYDGPFIYVVQAVGKGRVELDVIPLGLKGEADIVSATVDVDAGQGPIPPPKPPEPKPDDPSTAPIPVPGLRVLIVYESADLPKMPPAQNAIIFSAKVREYLNGACVVGPDGKTREYRMWDKDTVADGESKLWQDAFKRTATKISEWKPTIGADGKPVGPATALPWLLISNGKTGFEGALPADVDAFLALVKKYEVK